RVTQDAGGTRILTLGNAGSLSSVRYGTVCSVVCELLAQERLAQAWVCETRPKNQGARLACWEYLVCGVPHALISDAAAASVMAKGWVDAVLVGADRICANGDVIAQTGTYALAQLAHAHDIPFIVVANSNTIDLSSPSGNDVRIEQRDPRELEGAAFSGVILPTDAKCSRGFDLLTEPVEKHVVDGERTLELKGGHQMAITRKGGAYAFDAWLRQAPAGVLAYNPAFDVTPAALISTYITQDGPRQAPFSQEG
ncbi:MAG: hypothetical protein IJJ14_02250, partial [Coriobacteriales bacterium]|nr:hypothetical protein [Coriobacteriales bacterium]